MSLNQSPATANLPRIATREKSIHPGWSPARQTGIRRIIRDAGQIHAAIGFTGAAILYAGGALAILCTISAAQAGAPYPVSFAAGFCTLACSAGFCAALVAIVNVTGTVTPTTEKTAAQLCRLEACRQASRLGCVTAVVQHRTGLCRIAGFAGVGAGDAQRDQGRRTAGDRNTGRKPGCDRSGAKAIRAGPPRSNGTRCEHGRIRTDTRQDS
jgi:hypothetical protein